MNRKTRKVAPLVKNLPAMQGTACKATHSSILAWEISWMEESGGLQSIQLQESDTMERLNHHHHSRPSAHF